MGPSAVAFANAVYLGEILPKKGHTEVWTANYGYAVWQHDLLFNMRDLVHERQHNPAGDFIEAYREHPVPVVTFRYVKDIKNCYEFPFEEMFRCFGDQYFSNSPAYMVAFALMCGVKELDLYGLDYNYPDRTDYEAGRACLEYWIGRAVERGVDVRIPPSSMLTDMYQRSFQNGQANNGMMYGCQDMRPVFDTTGKELKLVGWRDRNEPY